MARGRRLFVSFAVVLAAVAGAYVSGWARSPGFSMSATPPALASPPAEQSPVPPGFEKATLASGCFWSTEAAFDDVDGVIATTSGYTGGSLHQPTYGQVSSGGTGHVEAVQVVFDPHLVTFEQLLDQYWRNVDLFNGRGQFCDYGEHYRPAIFTSDPAQRAAAEASRARMQRRFDSRIAVEILDAAAFYPAEEYHQNYAAKNPIWYGYYRWGCGRDARLAQIWRPPT